MATVDTTAGKRATEWLKANAAPVRKYISISIALGLVTGVLILVQTALLVGVVNGVMFRGLNLRELMPGVWLLLAVILLRASAQYASRRAGYASASRVKLDTRSRLLRRIRELGPARLPLEHSGELANTVLDGVEALEGYYARYLPQRAIASMLPLIILAVAYPLDWISGIIFTGTAVFIPV